MRVSRAHAREWVKLLVERPPADPLARRDPSFIRGELEWLGPLLDRWFDPEVRGLEHIPDGPVLMVGSHNGGIMAPDMFIFMTAIWRYFGVERPAYGLAHDQVLRTPIVGRWIAKLGAVPASRGCARALLARGAGVLVYPGGDLDTFKPFRERHLVKFGGRHGFVRAALSAGVSIVPIVSVGAHQTYLVLTDGRALAGLLQLKRLFRVEVVPIYLCLPYVLGIGPYEAHLPVPSKIKLEVLPPIRFDEPPEAARDDELVARLGERVRLTMQAAVDRLVAEGGFGVRERIAGLLGRGHPRAATSR